MTDNADDASSNTFNGGFKDRFSGNNYIHGDANGNMTKDNNKDISSIQYNHLNLPTQVLFDHGGSILYTYDATGVKLKKEIFLNAPNFNNPVADFTTYYAGNYIYEKESTTESLQFFSHPEGYVEKNGSNFEYVYQYKDHLGNIRLSYADTDNNGSIDANSEIISEKNYYPFGLEHKGYNNVVQNSNSAASRFKFGGKEFNDELGLNWYDVSARNYDPALGRWMNIDPLAEQMRRHSPYNYAFDNPIRFTDPDGMKPAGCTDSEGNPMTCPDGFESFTGPTITEAHFNEDSSISHYSMNNIQLDASAVESSSQNDITTVTENLQGIEKGVQNLAKEEGFSLEGLVVAISGSASGSLSTKFFNETAETWTGFAGKNGLALKEYSFSFNGNGATGGKLSFGKATSRMFKGAGFALGAYSFYDIAQQRANGEIDDLKTGIEGASSIYSTFGGTYGAAWGIGWELGRMVESIPGYDKNFRYPVRKALGIPRNGYTFSF